MKRLLFCTHYNYSERTSKFWQLFTFSFEHISNLYRMGDNDEDVNYLKFGKDFEGVEYIANHTVNLLLKTVKASADGKKNQTEVFEKAASYCEKFGGALQNSNPEAIDELGENLGALEFIRSSNTVDDMNENTMLTSGSMNQETRIKLASYEIVALINLNPSSAAAAKSLIPSLDKLTDSEIENDILKLLKRSSTRYVGLEE